MRKIITVSLVAIFAMSLTACTKSSDASTGSSLGPSKWSQAEIGYLQEIYAAKLEANQVIPEGVYVDMGNTVCQGLDQGRKAAELMALLAATAEKNGLPKSDRETFGPTIGAAAVAYLCPANVEKLVQ